jgi:hypothetical protein
VEVGSLPASTSTRGSSGPGASLNPVN